MSTNLIRFVPCEIGFKNVMFANSDMNLKDLNYETGHFVPFRSRWCQNRNGYFNLELYRYIQIKSDETTQSLNKPYVNDVYLTGQNLA